jgi:hypothetical protein
MRKTGHQPDADLGAALPFADRAFDAVFCTEGCGRRFAYHVPLRCRPAQGAA